VSAALRIEALACARGGRTLFEGIDLSLAAGGAVLVTGPNGAGKSSLLRVIAGLLDPAAGRVQVTGGLALADEGLALDRDRPLAQALGFWAALDGGDAGAALAAVGMAHLAEVPVRILSTGQRKRAVLARTIASGAEIWLLDEPANGLDAVSLDALTAAMAAHRAKGGIVVAASHQPLGLPGAVEVRLG
jgi:heme exporter protein A